MNDLLFYALLIALLYYFFFYLPQPKKEPTPTTPLTHSQFTQTATHPQPAPIEDQKDLEKTLDNLIKNIQQLNRQIK